MGERCVAVFKALDVDQDGKLSSEEFAAIFKQKATVRKGIAVMEGVSVSEGDTIGKVEPGDEIELFDLPKEHADMLRSECKMADGRTGWITVRGNEGSVYVDIPSPFDKFFE